MGCLDRAPSLHWVLGLAVAIRLGLVIWGEWQDRHWAVHYTDIDYDVVTDGARAVLRGASPYTRATYRYTPFLAWMALPNLTVHAASLKLMYCMADILAAWLIVAIISERRTLGSARKTWAAIGACMWLFSPLTAVISTRGSGESLVACMLLGMLFFLCTDRTVPAAICFGVAVHWRLYPIIYSLPVLRHLANKGPWWSGGLVSRKGAQFGVVSASVFGLLGAVGYAAYGTEFIRETYMYHFSRVDPRHNFSPYFLPAYLGSENPGTSPFVGRVFSIAQMCLVVLFGWDGARSLTAAMFLQTLAFVAFNKVCTAQYFVWYWLLLPLVAPILAGAANLKAMMVASAVWVVAVAHWLTWAYALEFLGWSAHLQVWVASLVLLIANTWLIGQIWLSIRIAGRQHDGSHAKAA